MNCITVSRMAASALCLCFLLVLPPVHAAPPDLTASGAITALKTDTTASPLYSLSYNLGPTGLRGWMYLRRGYGTTYGQDGTMTDEDRQILVTVVGSGTPAAGILAVDDVILGVGWGSGTDPLPMFTSDARKAFGAAITEAEKSENGGILRIKRWRAGVTTDVSITLSVMGTYSASAPYNCPKSALILASARNRLVAQLLANPNFLTSDWKGAVSALALLSGVAPGDPDYNTVQTRLQTYARAVATAGPVNSSLPIWNWGYLGIFLAEYYLATGDTNVLPGINQYSLKLAQTQSMFGTFGHGPALPRPDGTGRMSVAGYGPVNATGLPANLAMVMGKKALLAGTQTVDPQIDAAIQRASDFFSWYVNKGSIPYGEHHPGASDHASNGKDQAAALFFGQQDNRPVETEYFTRMSVAGFTGRECGHTGQGFSYLWEGLATSVGGQLAVSEYFKPVRWHLDLTRRTDGSFAYDGGEQYDAGKTSDGTYLGFSGYYDLNPTACYLLTYSLPLKRLYITGKNANPAHELDSTKVANAVAASTYKFDRTSRSTTQLIADLGEYDPVVRNFAAQALAARTLTTTELTTLRTMLSGSNANERMGACQTLGLRKDSTAMNMITQRLDKTVETDPWVRGIAADALRDYGTAANSEVNTMLARFVDNASDPDTIVWSDPLQAGNGKLSFALFDSAPGTSYFDFSATTITAAKNLLYPAVSNGFKHPDSAARQGPAIFAFNRMPIGDVQAMPNDFIHLILSETQCDRMWSSEGRRRGIQLLSKYKFIETMSLGLSVLNVPTGFEHGSSGYVDQALAEIATFGESARWTLPTLRGYLGTWANGSTTHTALVNAINSIEAATTSPTSPYAISYLKAAANRQVVTTAAGIAKAITLTGSSCREPSVSFTILTQPSNGTLTGTAPNLTYTPNPGYTGPDQFTFRTADTLTTSEPATVGIVVGTAGNGLKGEYFDNSNFSNLVLTRTDAQVNFDWGTGSPNASINADTFSVRWSGLLLVPETCAYTFSALSNDGVRVYINGNPVIDNFVDQNTKWKDSAPIQLTKGQLVEIQMDYYENTGSAAAKLKWTGPSVAGLTGAIIPQAYLFDGTGMTRTPYAFAQSLTMLKNQSQAIILSGSSGTVSYSVVTPPAHGTLSGTAPNLTYTPFANYIGLDSFTFKVNNGTSDSAPATISIDVIPANTFGVNFYAYGALSTPEAQANLKLSPGMSAGLADWFTYGWTNVEVPWAPSSPQPPVTLTSNRGNTATFVLKDCRNGGPYNWSVPRTTLLGDGNGNLMDGHVNSTLDGPNLFDMEVTGIPFAVYDVIFYMGANKDQYGTGTGVIKFNGGADRAFTLKSGAFNGTFIEMVNATTQGNYIIFSGVTGASFTAQTWGTGPTGFNHIGPCGIQIREAVVIGNTTTTLVSSPNGTGSYGDAVTFTATVSGSGVPATGMVTFKDGNTVLGTSVLDAGTAAFTTNALTVANHSITATYDGNGSFYGSVSSPLAHVVTPKAVTVTGVTAGNKVYDGNNSAALTGGTVSGVIGGETVTLVPGSGSFVSPNAGTWAVTASGYSLAGTHAGNYTLASQPAVPNATITPRPVQLSGTRTYNGTATLAAGTFNISNNLDGANLTLAGDITLANKDAGSQALQPVLATPVLRQNTTGTTGSSASTSISAILGANPLDGNTLIAVISTRGSSASRVSGISGGGVTWTRVSQAVNSSGTTTEIWYGPNVSSGTKTITITQASLISAAVVMEYSGLLTPTSFDLAANSFGSSTAAVTGNTGMTSQANELLIGGIGIADGRRTLNAPYGNNFAFVASSQSGGANSDAMIYVLQKIVNAPVDANTGGTVSTSDGWSGAIATFKVASTNNLTLSGSAAANYTLTGFTGSVTITPKNLTVSGLAAANKTYNGTAAAPLTGTAALLAAQAPGSGNTNDGKPYTGDAVTLGGTPSGTFADKHAGTGKPVTVTGLTLGGAQAGNYTLTQPTGLSANIAALPVTVAAVDASKTYDGTTTASGTPTINPALSPGDTTTTLSQSFQTPDAGAGNKVIVPAITINDGNGGANYTVTLQNYLAGTISTAAATVTLGNLSAIYDGTPKSVSVGTNPGGLATTLTYEGSPTPPTNAGSYAVSATINDANYVGTASGTLVIAKAAATITLGDLSATYDGTPKAVSVGTSPASLTTQVTYNGSSTAPTDAGSYAVAATVSDTNYMGSASDTLVITGNLMSSWRSVHFSVAEITAGLADDTANPDGDDFNNLKEYILGTDPRAFSVPPLAVSPAAGSQFTLSFLARAASSPGYTGKTRKYDVEWSSDPTDPNGWHGVDGHTGIVGNDSTVQVTLPIDSARKFFRLNVRVE